MTLQLVDWWTLPGAAPVYATRRDPELPTDGPRIEVVARSLGTPLIPWQRYVSHVATERIADAAVRGGWRYRYPIVVVSVPRQSGKTTELRSVGVERGISREDCGVFYSAQTGKDARERWQDAVKAIKASPLAPLATIRSAAGSERVVWPNGSSWRCFPPLPHALHGYTPPLVMLDEAFAHDEQLGNDLMGAIGPAQVTIPHRQLWIVSTAGTARSVFLHRWIERGLRGDDGVALFLWRCPDGWDSYDPARWQLWHPGMATMADGHQLVTHDALRAEADRLPRSEWERAYANRFTRTVSHHIAAESWDRLGDDEQRSPTPDNRVVFGWDTMHDRSWSAVTAAWRYGDQLQLRPVRTGPGTSWVLDTLDQLRQQGHTEFAYAADGPARELADEWEHNYLAKPVTGREYADSWGKLLRHIADRTMRHDGSEQLATAAANVATRPSLDAAAPSRRASAGDVTPLLAGMVAAWVLDRDEPAGELSYRFAG